VRRRRLSSTSGVELNVTAMLDMAFQLLAFFILTFRPAPIEGQLMLHLPPPQPTTHAESMTLAGSNPKNMDHAAGLNTLVISAFADQTGRLASMAVGEAKVDGLTALDRTLRGIFGDPDLAFDQVIVQVSATLRYEDLMRIMDVCARQKVRGGKTLSTVSFVELPAAAPAKE
jgi:biopolymer transport protein ExbD